MKDKLIAVTDYYQGRGVRVPMIRLRGRWLARAGFEQGQRVRVELLDGLLVLIPLPPDPSREEPHV